MIGNYHEPTVLSTTPDPFILLGCHVPSDQDTEIRNDRKMDDRKMNERRMDDRRMDDRRMDDRRMDTPQM
jgi:hypothetical protein